MKKNNNIFKELLNNKRVNNYTKMLIILNSLDYYKDYYIPNRKLMNILSLDKKSIVRLLINLKEDNLISIFYLGRKRYFTIKMLKCKEEKQLDFNTNVLDYNWLEEE